MASWTRPPIQPFTAQFFTLLVFGCVESDQLQVGEDSSFKDLLGFHRVNGRLKRSSRDDGVKFGKGMSAGAAAIAAAE